MCTVRPVVPPPPPPDPVHPLAPLWAKMVFAPQKSSVTLFTSDTHQFRIHPQVRIGDVVAPLNRTAKILSVTVDTHFTFGPHARDCVERASRALNVMKALAGSSWCFTTLTLVATYKAIVCPIINYAAPIWFTQVSSSHLDKLEVIQNKALRVATGRHQKARRPTSGRTEILPLRAHLELCSQQFYMDGTPPGRSIPGRSSTV